jgi:regulator of RNase E activity RraA
VIRRLADVVVSLRDTDHGPRVELTADRRGKVVMLSLTPSDAAVVGALLATTAHSATNRPNPPPAR